MLNIGSGYVDSNHSNFLTSVKDQYEDHPYPPRDAENERTSLIKTESDSLGKISHYCFRGKLDPGNHLRVLVAGGGTGDATIFLAEQLKGHNAEAVYLDLSRASMDIAKKRAHIRGLNNITWIQGSILDLPGIVPGKFDYINCCGVLHHLEDPTQGLQSLKACLKDDGAIGIMVYARYGRTGVYHMQELMKLINTREIETSQKIANTRSAIKCMPETNCLRSGPIPLTDAKASELSDADLVDLFLHTQDRPYTVTEIYKWLEECGLQLVDFACNKPLYEPETHIKDPVLLRKVMTLPKQIQQAISECLVSTIYRHTFYASFGQQTIASPNDDDNIPYFCDLLPLSGQATLQLQRLIAQQPVGTTFRLRFQEGNTEIFLPIEKLTKYIFRHIDGKTTIKNIIKSVKHEKELAPYKLTTKAVSGEFKKLYKLLNRQNVVLLRGKKIPPYKTGEELQASVSSANQRY